MFGTENSIKSLQPVSQMGPTFTTIVLQNEKIVKLSSRYLCLYTKTSAAFSLDQNLLYEVDKS